MLALLLGCPSDVDRGALPGGADGALVATTTDFAVGSFAVVDLASGDVDDDVFVTSGDPLVVADAGGVVQLNGYLHDSARRYDVGDWREPRFDVGMGEGANPTGAATVGDATWISRYDAAELWILDAAGDVTDTVDLSAWADPDGVPEMGDLLVADGVVWLALQRFDRDAGWAPNPGRVLAFDPETLEVVVDVELGPSPRLWPRASGGVWVTTGTFATTDAGFEPRLDGDLRALDVDGTVGPIEASEADLGAKIEAFREVDGGAFWMADAGGGAFSLRSGWPGAATVDVALTGWPSDLVVDDVGRAWVAERDGLGGHLAVYDADAAELGAWQTTLPPYRLAVAR
jgi:hypothetical protein